jgi:hypothetical protein
LRANLTTAPRCYYVYDGQGNAANMIGGSGTIVATHSSDNPW